MGTLNGKTALVTGGCGGIGTAICKRFAAEGVNVITTYINEKKIPAWKEALGTNAAAFRCDVSSYDDCVNLREQISAEFDSVDIVVNNAGITRDGSFKKTDGGNLECGDCHQSRQSVQYFSSVCH
jgi:acetoacetyl-CoA reductase